MELYKGKRIAILRGYKRLIDGESTSVEEMYLWGLKNDVKFHSFYLHPVQAKYKGYNDCYKHTYTIFNKDMADDIVKEINENYDLTILVNPAKLHSGLKKEDVIVFHKLYKKIEIVKVQMQHTTFMRAINETPFQWSLVNSSDAVYNHSDQSYFMNAMVKKLPSKKDRAYPMHLWTDVEKYKDFYKNEDRENNLTYIGRPCGYKGPVRLLNISEQVLNKNIKPVIYGMDLSIGCKNDILDHRNCNNLLRPHIERTENPIVDTYGKIDRDEVMNKFNKSLFACTLFRMKNDLEKSFYGDRLEYTMQEAIMAGSILVVDKDWAETCRTIDKVRYADIPYFAIMMDEEYPYEAIVEMERVMKDKELQKKYRDTAFEVLRKEYDSSVVLPKLMNELLSITIDEDKFKDDYDLVKFLTGSESKAEKFIELYNDGYLIPMAPNSMKEGKLSVFGGVSGKAVIEIR